MPKKATDIGLPEELNVMLYGEYGSGKTTFATTFPKPILFFDIDDRQQTYAGVEGVEYDVYKDEGRTVKAYREFFKDLQKYQKKDDYATVVLDSTTTLLRIMKNDLLGRTGTGRGATEGIDLSQWGTVVERYEKIFDIFKSYNAHKIVISHDQMIKDDLTGEIKNLPMMVGKKFPQRAPLYFDEIYYCYSEEDRDSEETKYLARTQTKRKKSARSSLNLRDDEGKVIPILNEVEPQNFQVIMDKVEEARSNPKEYIKKVKRARSS